MPKLRNGNNGVRTRALSIASPAFYQLSYRALWDYKMCAALLHYSVWEMLKALYATFPVRTINELYKFRFDFRSIYTRSVRAVRNRKIAPWNRTGAENKGNHISLSGRLSEKLNYYIRHFSRDETFSGSSW